MMNKLHYLSMLGLVATNVARAEKLSVQPKSEKPLNIIYIMSDDHAKQAISCYDKRHITTPNIDRLASEGVRFTNGFVCNSISGPSRAAMLTGKHSHMNGKKDNLTAFDNNQQTFPKVLQNAGYETAMIGKWHLEGTPQGFDYWEILPGQGEYYNPDFITPNGKVHRDGYVTNVITDMSIDFLNKRDKEKPFCMFVHHKAVHRIWMGNIPDLNEFEDRIFEMPDNFWDTYQGREAASKQKMSIDKDMDLVYDLKMKDPSLKTPYGDWFTKSSYARMSEEQKKAWDATYDPIIKQFMAEKLEGRELAEWKYQRYMRDYMKTVKSLDDNIGRLYDYLKTNDLLDNTLIVYTSDQGFYLGEHGWFDKRFMYEESFGTPLVMRLPSGYKKRGVVDQLVQNIDFGPTFLDMAGCQVPNDMQGLSFKRILKGEKISKKDWRKSLYYHFYEYPGEHAVRRHYGVRTERYKLIHFYREIDSWELYDLKKDPNEMENLIDNPKYASVVNELKIELVRLQKEYQVKEADL